MSSAINALCGFGTIPARACDSVDFNGSTNFAYRLTDLTGNADGKTGMFSVWTRIDGSVVNTPCVFTAVTDSGVFSFNSELVIPVAGAANLAVGLNNATGVNILDLRTSTKYSAGATWRHWLAAWNLATGYAKFYVTDTDDTNLLGISNDTANYAGTGYQSGVGAFQFGGGAAVNFDGCIAELYYAPNQFLDITIQAIRRRFISASGKPVHLGVTGNLPTGASPLVYLHIDDGESVANFFTNRAGNGNYTSVGSFSAGSTSPSD